MALAHSTVPPSSRGTVVVIDDSPTALAAVTKWLEMEGFDVVALSRSLGATKTIMQVRPSVLLLDIKLPGLSGDRLAMVLSQNPATASLPVIFYSQIDPAEMKRLAHACSVVGAISKTSDRGLFLREFEKLAAPFLAARASSRPSSSTAGPASLTIPPSIGVPELDDQHRRIAEMLHHIGGLIRSMNDIEDKPSLRRELRENALKLIVFMKFHLATEDRHMREAGYSAIDEHRVEHAAFLDTSTALERRIEADTSAVSVMDAARELRRLIQEHTWSSDLNLGPVRG